MPLIIERNDFQLFKFDTFIETEKDRTLVSYVIFEGVVTLANQTFENTELVYATSGVYIQRIKSTYYSLEGVYQNPLPAGMHMMRIEQQGDGLHNTIIKLDGVTLETVISMDVSRAGYPDRPNTTTIELVTIPIEYAAQPQKSRKEAEKFFG